MSDPTKNDDAGGDDANGQIQDAARRNWVDRWAPAGLQPWLRLARLDRPIGIWLLLWPCMWSIMLATGSADVQYLLIATGFSLGNWQLALPDPMLFLWFFLGAAVMRGAGCTWNDILDRNLDASVARTRLRPLPSGQISLQGAVIFLGAELILGLLILLQLNTFSVYLGAASLVLIAFYPLMKRITWWPQAFLGLTFNWGALLGWTAVVGNLSKPAGLLYIGCIFWTLGYDTIYAHQDKEDDALAGIKSTARLLGKRSRAFIAASYISAVIFFAVAASLTELNPWFYGGLVIVLIQLMWQVGMLKLDDADDCLRKFRSNHVLGLMMFVAIVIGNLH